MDNVKESITNEEMNENKEVLEKNNNTSEEIPVKEKTENSKEDKTSEENSKLEEATNEDQETKEETADDAENVKAQEEKVEEGKPEKEVKAEETEDKTEEDVDSEEAIGEEEKSQFKKEMEMYEKTMETVKKGNVVEGEIIRIDEPQVLVDIGYKAEGVIPISEFKNEKPVEGDKVSVYIVSKEDKKTGRPRLSKRKADVRKTWNNLEEANKKDELIRVHIDKRVKGGLIANHNGIQCFLPASQVSTKKIPNLDHFIDEEFDVKIINFNRPKSNIVISRKLVLQKERIRKKKKLMDKLEEGKEVDGEVKNIMDYGVFVDLGGIDGLVHVSDMSWGHINHPSEMLSIGDKVKVKVLSFDKEKEKVSLGIKQLVPHPWKNIEIKYPEGSKVKGVVTNLTTYGAFVELEKGVEGLIHVSEMSWTKKVTHPKQVVNVGDEVETIVLKIDKEEHRISLGLKQIEPNPWLTIDVLHPKGSTVTGKIKNITEFGAFMEVADDIDGLIHISDISWTKRIMHPKEVLSVGQEVTAKVLSIDKVMQRIALGIKQLEPDPWEGIEEKMPLNSEHEVSISTIIDKGAIVKTEKGIEGFVPTSHLGIPGLQEPELAFDKGEKIPVKVIEVDKNNRRLILSVKTYFFGREENKVNQFVKDHLKKIRENREKRNKDRREERQDDNTADA